MSGAFRNTFWTDDGQQITAPGTVAGFGGAPATPVALLVPDSSASGYSEFPIAVDADQSFSVPEVPGGSYFLEMEKVVPFKPRQPEPCPRQTSERGFIRQFFEMTTSSPDLGSVSSARSDLTRRIPSGILAKYAQIDADITNADVRDPLFLAVASSQALAAGSTDFLQLSRIETTYTGFFRWPGDGWPDAAKNDVVFLYELLPNLRVPSPGEPGVARATKFARLADLTLVEGSRLTTTIPLLPAPQTGSVSVDARVSEFERFNRDPVDITGPGSFLVTIVAVPHSTSYPEMPSDGVGLGREIDPVLLAVGPPRVDGDYGSFTYGQFLDPLWKEVRRVRYESRSVIIQSDVPMSDLPAGPIVPVVSPPESPRLEIALSGAGRAGRHPTISWSAPAIGTPTSYVIDLIADPLGCVPLEDTLVGLSAVVHDRTSFKLPPGIRTDLRYRLVITARIAPWDSMNAGPFRTGTPLHFAQTVIDEFVF